jgi:hypothetical protein
MTPRITVFYGFGQGLYHTAALYAGLDALARTGAIALSIRRPKPGEGPLQDMVSTLSFKTAGEEGDKERWIAIDTHDRSDAFAMGLLESCDLYLKRSFYPPDLARLPTELRDKLRPFGLNYACRTRRGTRRLLRAVGPYFARHGMTGIRLLRGHLQLPMVNEFEQAPTTPLEPTIIFQTRVWAAEDTALGEHDAINEQRVAIIRALRKEFGPRFVGGLVPTPLAMERYPNEISTHSSRRRLYTALSKRSLIGVYSRGLHDSTAFKLPEYLAASQCIVAEPPRNELPAPLIPGTHYLPYQNPEECVAACRRLLDDNKLAMAMRNANQAYYRSEVEPSAHVLRLLERTASKEAPCAGN